LITLLIIAVLQTLYRRCRTDLDAQGAEILREFKARAAARRRDDG
jgi:hypothetical protein